jgi:hypothetical protein
MAMYIVFQRKRQNWNRAKVVGVLSVLAKVKNGPYNDFVNGLLATWKHTSHWNTSSSQNIWDAWFYKMLFSKERTFGTVDF